jgi:phenylalanyl-tRNA synthetase beta chain
MLGMLAWNLNRDVPGARLFEMGSVYQMSGTERVEPKRACLGATAAAVRASLPAKGNLDVSKGEQAAAVEAFRGFKGDVENLLAAFAGEVIYERTTAEYLHPVRSAQASVNGSVIAQFGQIHPEVATARKLRQEIFLAEFDLDAICRLGLHPVRFTPLAKYPAVERDFSFVFDDRVTFEQLKRAVEAGRSPELQEFLPVEIFRGGSIPAGKYSILLRARFQSTERTLHDEEIAGWSAKIVASLTSLGGTQRA